MQNFLAYNLVYITDICHIVALNTSDNKKHDHVQAKLCIVKLYIYFAIIKYVQMLWTWWSTLWQVSEASLASYN